MAKNNPSPKEIIAGLVYFDNTELPQLRNDIDSIGPSLTNAANCMQRMHNIVTYLVRHCLQNAVMAAAAARAQAAPSIEEQQAATEEQNRAILAAAAGAPAGTAVPMPANVPGMTSIPIPIPGQQVQPVTLPAHRNVVVGRNDDATTRLALGGAATQETYQPEVGDVPLVIIGQGGSTVIPPKGSGVAPKTFAPGQPIDTSFATAQAAAPADPSSGLPEGEIPA